MKAWMQKEFSGLGAGLGKMDIIFIPMEEGGKVLAVCVHRDGRVWLDSEEGELPDKKGLFKVEISEELAKEVNAKFNKEVELSEEEKEKFKKLGKKIGSVKRSVLR